jgi:hypothetical protein
MTYRLLLLTIAIISLGFDSRSQTPTETRHIEQRISAFSARLSSFPPAVKDSNEAKILSQQLLSFVDSLKDMRNERQIRNDEQYYLWMATLYHFGYNLNIPGSWKEGESFFQKVLELNPKSNKARMGLSAHYANNWNPGDPKSFNNLDKGFSLLHDVYRDGGDSANPALYHNLILYGLFFHSKAIFFDALTKLKKYCPEDTSVSELSNLNSTISDSCIALSLDGSSIRFENKCAGFGATYPDYFLLFRQSTDGNGISTLMVETPLTRTSSSQLIRNSLSISAVPVHVSSEGKLISTFLARGGMTLDSSCTLSKKQFKSFYVSSRDSHPEQYLGVYSTVTAKNYCYQIIYIATKSTFGKNLPFFLAFEDSVILL